LSASFNGEIPPPATIGGSNSSSSGIGSATTSVADGINPETGALTASNTDFSLPGFGPDLSLTRTYSSLLAQQQTAAGTPGPMGYGWSYNLDSSLSFSSPVPGWLYRAAGPTGTTSGTSGDNGPATSAYFNNPEGIATDSVGDVFIADTSNNRIQMIAAGYSAPLVSGGTTPGYIYTVGGDPSGSSGTCSNGSSEQTSCLSLPTAVAVDPQGDVYIADSGNNNVEEISAYSHTQFGISMGAQKLYTIAGSSSGTGGTSKPANGTAATSALLNVNKGIQIVPDGTAFDLYIVDTNDNVVEEVPASSAGFWGISMTANDIYVVAGNGTAGHTGNGGAATSAELWHPAGIGFDQSGNMYIADDANSRAQEVAVTGHTQWGQSMTANYVYTVAGNSGGAHGNSGDGGPATSALLADDFALTLDQSSNLYLVDENNNEIQEVPSATGDMWGQAMTSGDIYTVAGSALGSSGNLGGLPASEALMSHPAGVAIDPWGDMYIGDNLDNKVREVVATPATPMSVNLTGGGVTVNQGSGTQTTFYPVSSAFSVTNATWSSGVATISAANSVSPGGTVTVSGVSPGGYNGTFTVQSATAGQFTVNITSNPGTYSSGGTAAGCQGPTVIASAAPGAYCALPEDQGSLTTSGGNYLYTDGSNLTTTFDSTGTLVSEANLAGDTLTVTPGSPAPGSGHCPSNAFICDSVASAAGRTIVLAFDLNLNIFQATDPLGRAWTYAYTNSQLTSATDPLGNKTSYTYGSGTGGTTDMANDLLTVTEQNGQSGGRDAGAKETDAYDTSGRIATQTDRLGNTTTVCYQSGGSLCTSTASLNQSMGLGTVQVFDPQGNETDYGFDHGALSSQKVWSTANVTGAGYSGTTATVNFGVKDASGTALAAGLVPAVGSTITVAGITPSAYNGTFTVTASAPGSVSYTASGLSAYTSGGTVTAPAERDFGPDLSYGTLLNKWTSDENGNQTNLSYDGNGNVTSTQDPLGNTNTSSYDANTNTLVCSATAMASTNCAGASPPASVPAGGIITPPSSAPPQGVDYSLVDHDGNTLYTTTGVYEPGSSSAFQSSAAYVRTTYTLFKGNSVTLRAWGPGQSGFSSQTVSCTNTPPSQTLPCATVDENGIVTQLAYDSYGDLTSSSTPDGNGSDVSKTTNTYDNGTTPGDGELTGTVSPDGNLAGANSGNYTTTTVYNADDQVTSVTEGNGSGYTDTPRTTSYGYDGDGNQTTVENANGKTTTTTYNAGDQATLVTDPLGNQALTCFDANGNAAQTVPAFTITNATISGGTATITAANSLTAGTNHKVVVAGVVSSGQPGSSYNGTFTVASASSTQFTYALGGTPGTYTSGGSAIFAPSECPTSYPTGYGPSNALGHGTGIGSTAATTTYDGQGFVVAQSSPTGTGGSASYSVSTTSYDPAGNTVQTEDPPSAGSGTYNVGYSTYDAAENDVSDTTGCAPSQTRSTCMAKATVTGASWSSSTATVTAANSFVAGETVTIGGVGPSGYNGTFAVLSSPAPTSSHFSYSLGTNPGTYTSGGTASPASVSTTSTCRDPNGDETSTVSANGNVGSIPSCSSSYPYTTSSAYQTTEGFDSIGESVSTVQPATSSAPNGITTSASYDPAGNVIAATDEMGTTTVSSYTPGGNLASETYSNGVHVTGASWSSSTATVTAANTFTTGEKVTVSGVSPSGFNGTITVASALPTQFTYSLGSNPGSYSSGGTATAAVTNATWSSNTATITVANSFNVGQKAAVAGISPSGYNGTVTVTAASSTSFSYALGTNPGTYSSGGTVSLPMPQSGSCTGSATMCFSYDAENNRTQMVDGTGTTSYTFDNFGETTAVKNPTGPTVTCNGSTNTTCYAYDKDGNATSVTYPLPAPVSVTGASWAMSTATMTSANSYSPGDTVIVSGVSPSGYNGTFAVASVPAPTSTQFSYTLNTNPGSYSSGGTATWHANNNISIGYDAADNPTTITDFTGKTSPYAVAVTNNAAGENTSTTLGVYGGTNDTISSSYDNGGSPTSIALKQSGSTLESFAYSYALSGDVLSETDTGAGLSGTNTCNGSSVTVCNAFDQQTRLGANTIGSSATQSYLPEADANPTALPPPGGSSTQPLATYDKADELTKSVGSATTNYLYDGDGQLASENQGSGNTVTMVPDAAGNVTAYNNTNTTTNTGGNMSSATYNGDGLWVADTVTPAGGSSHSQNFTYDMSGGAGLLMDSNYAFVYGPDGTTEQVNLGNGEISYLLTDAEGSVRGVVSGSSGSVTRSTTYDAFGNPQTAAVSQGGVNYPGLTVNTPIGSGGLYTDPTGLQTDGSDMSDPTTGQDMASVAASGNKNGHMRVFWDRRAHGNGSAYPKKSEEYADCHTRGWGWIFTGATAGPPDNFETGTPCTGFFYNEGDHGNPEHYNKFAIDWQMVRDEPIYAQYSGWVTFSGLWNQQAGGCGGATVYCGYGYAVVVQYKNGITAWYGHMNRLRFRNVSYPNHKQWVAQGTPLGKSGRTGLAQGTNKQIKGPYADHVHVGWGRNIVLYGAHGLFPGAPHSQNSGYPIPQASRGTPLYTGCRTHGPYRSSLTSLHAHEQVPSCFP
jgi:YD repeat-containing protein